MIELGLLQYWMDIHTQKINLSLKKCFETAKQIEPEKQANRKPLTLSSLSGAFIFLLVSYIIATLAICFELFFLRLWPTCQQAFKKINLKSKPSFQVNKSQENVKLRFMRKHNSLKKFRTLNIGHKKCKVGDPHVTFEKTEVGSPSGEEKKEIPKPEIEIKVNHPQANFDLIEVISVLSDEENGDTIKKEENPDRNGCTPASPTTTVE